MIEVSKCCKGSWYYDKTVRLGCICNVCLNPCYLEVLKGSAEIKESLPEKPEGE